MIFRGLTVYDAQRAGNTMAADAFSKSTSDLAQGFAASMRANVGQANVALDNANARTILIKDKWQALRDQEAAYHARHISPGNAHNYLERYSRVLELYAQDVFEVLGKANALAGGLLGLYQRSTTPPKMEEPYPGFLDRLALWVRNEAQILDIAKQNEIQYTVIIPLAQPWKRDSGGIGIVSEEDILNTTQNSRPLKFNLSGVFKNQTRLRIRGVGLCFGTKPGEDTENWHDRVSCVRARATIHTPQLPEIQGFAKSRNRPPIVIGNVRFLLDDSQAEIVSGRCCANSAVEGDWTIYIEPFAVDADSEERNLYHVKWTWNTRVVTDFKLILKLASLPSESANSVFG